MWICSECSEENEDKYTFCCECGAARGKKDTQRSSKKMWTCSCGNRNADGFRFCEECGAPRDKKPDNSWQCSCGHRNPSTATYCVVCGKNRNSINTAVICITAACVALIVFCILWFTGVLTPDPVHAPTPEINTYQPVVTPTSSSASRANATSSFPVNGYTGNSNTNQNSSSNSYQNVNPVGYYTGWSEWSTEPVYASSTREVQTRQTVTGYYLVHYGTQKAEYPYYRMFRDYSINEQYSYYGARKSYGEKHLVKYVTAAQMAMARVYPPDGSFISIKIGDKDYEGYQLGTSNAYNFGDDLYFWYVTNTIETTEYRYRDMVYY